MRTNKELSWAVDHTYLALLSRPALCRRIRGKLETFPTAYPIVFEKGTL